MKLIPACIFGFLAGAASSFIIHECVRHPWLDILVRCLCFGLILLGVVLVYAVLCYTVEPDEIPTSAIFLVVFTCLVYGLLF